MFTFRKYYNLMTTVAAKNRDFINDNEDDGEPPWLVHTIKNMIYEFTDLNEAINGFQLQM